MSGSSVPRHIISLDTLSHRIEGIGTDQYYPSNLRMAVASYTKIERGKMQRIQTLTATMPETFWQWTYGRIKRRQTLWIVGNRVMEHLNLLGMWARIERGELTMDLLVDADPPSILIVRYGDTPITICDTRNWGDESVEDLAESLGDKLYHKPDDFSGDLERQQYLQSRVQVIRDWFGSLLIAWNESKLGKFRCTASGLAWSAYKTNHVPRGVLVHNCKESLEIERQSLAGGYTRVFRAGEYKGKVCVYDVNSLYSSVMLNLQAPAEWKFWLEDCTLDQLRQATEKHQVIAEVAVEQEDYPYPCRVNRERCWPIGTYYCTLCGDELLHAIEHDHIRRVYRISVYWPQQMFASWVTDMYGRRIDAAAKRQTHRERLYKLLLNSLCGRLGMRSQGWDWCDWEGWRPQWGSWSYADAADGIARSYRAIAGHVQCKRDDGETNESMPAIEAVINANARYRMYRDRMAIGEEHILYQGVDSLHVTQEGSDRLLHLLPHSPGRIGHYKLVSQHSYACYRGPMDYTLDDIHTVCGVTMERGKKPDVPLEWEERDTARVSLHRDPAGVVWSTRRSRVWGHLHVDGIITAGNRVIPPLIQTHVSGNGAAPKLDVVVYCPDWSNPHQPYCGDNELQ